MLIGPLETNFSKIIIKNKASHSWKCIWKYCLQKGGHFVQGEMSLSALAGAWLNKRPCVVPGPKKIYSANKILFSVNKTFFLNFTRTVQMKKSQKYISEALSKLVLKPLPIWWFIIFSGAEIQVLPGIPATKA